MLRPVFLIVLIVASSSAFAQSAQSQVLEIQSTSGCKYIQEVPQQQVAQRRDSTMTWNGQCVNQYVFGYGKLVISYSDGTRQEISTTFVQGRENGIGESITVLKTGTLSFRGTWANGARTWGKEEFTAENGKTGSYEGQYLNGKRHGIGVLRELNGNLLEGTFKEGRLDGFGKVTYPNSAVYEGNLAAGIPNGQGKMVLPNGEIRQGPHKNGSLIGIGEIRYPDGRVYSGEIHYDRPYGSGRLEFPSGAIYQGNFVGGRFDGRGVLKYADGASHEGIFKDGTITGEGVLTSASGNRYQGNFTNGSLNGPAKVKFANGTLIEATHSAGKAEGPGKVIYTNGFVGEGRFEQGKMEGLWILTSSNGDKYEVDYRNGTKISEKMIRPQQETSQSNDQRAQSRQRAIDSLTCEAYAMQANADQKVEVGPVPPGSAGIGALLAIGQGYLIGQMRQSSYESCMRRLGN